MWNKQYKQTSGSNPKNVIFGTLYETLDFVQNKSEHGWVGDASAFKVVTGYYIILYGYLNIKRVFRIK